MDVTRKIMEILKQPEDKSLEFKKEIPKNRLNLLKIMVAFANGIGGHIYLGVNNDRTVSGIKEEPFDLEEKLSSIIFLVLLIISICGFGWTNYIIRGKIARS